MRRTPALPNTTQNTLFGSDLIASMVRFVSRGKLLSLRYRKHMEANSGKQKKLTDIFRNSRFYKSLC